LLPIVNDMIRFEALYHPVTGKILDYVSFYALLCRNKLAHRTSVEKRKQQSDLVKSRDIDELFAMEVEAINSANSVYKKDIDALNVRRSLLENEISGTTLTYL